MGVLLILIRTETLREKSLYISVVQAAYFAVVGTRYTLSEPIPDHPSVYGSAVEATLDTATNGREQMQVPFLPPSEHFG